MSDGMPEQRVGLLERLIVHALIIAGGVVILRETASLSDQSAYIPMFLGWGLIALSLLSAAATLRSAAPRITDEAPLLKGGAALMLFAGFIYSSSHIGFLTSTLWFLPALAVLAGERRWLRLALMTIAFAIAAYLIFKLLFAQSLPTELILGEF